MYISFLVILRLVYWLEIKINDSKYYCKQYQCDYNLGNITVGILCGYRMQAVHFIGEQFSYSCVIYIKCLLWKHVEFTVQGVWYSSGRMSSQTTVHTKHCIYTCTRMHTHTCTHAHAHTTRTHMHTHVHTHVCTHKRTGNTPLATLVSSLYITLYIRCNTLYVYICITSPYGNGIISIHVYVCSSLSFLSSVYSKHQM